MKEFRQLRHDNQVFSLRLLLEVAVCCSSSMLCSIFYPRLDLLTQGQSCYACSPIMCMEVGLDVLLQTLDID